MTVPEMNDQSLPIGTKVETADGKHLGEIKEIQSDHYVVEKGLIFIDDFFIPKSAIIAVENNVARVGLNESDLESSGWEEPPIYEDVNDLAFDDTNPNPITNDPLGVIAPSHEDEQQVIDGTGNTVHYAAEDELTRPVESPTDQAPPRRGVIVQPGAAWEERPEGLDEPLGEAGGGIDQLPRKDDSGSGEKSGSLRQAQAVSGTPASSMSRIQFDVGLPVRSADGHHVGDVMTVSPHHVMIERGKLFKHDFSIPKTAFAERREGVLYLNVPAAALDRAGWETRPEPGVISEVIDPVDARRNDG